MGETNLDVTTIRESFLQELKERVDSAYNNRKPFSEIAINHDIERRKSLGKKMQQMQEDDVEDGEFEPTPNQVWVDNPHDYPALFAMGLNKIFKGNNKQDLTRYEVKFRAILEDNLRHEYQHHVPAIGQENLKIHYMLTFDETENGGVGLTPSIQIEGKMTKKLYLDVIHGPDDPSIGDIADRG